MRMIHVLRKPMSEKTVAANTLKHGCGGLNIAASRVGAESRSYRGSGVSQMRYTDGRAGLTDGRGRDLTFSVSGRWPDNVILQHLDGCRCEGVKKVKGSPKTYVRKAPGKNRTAYSEGVGQDAGVTSLNYADKDGKETVANWICEPGCPVARLDEQSGERKTTWIAPSHKNNRDGDFMGALNHPGHQGYNDTGGASRFFKQVGGGEDA